MSIFSCISISDWSQFFPDLIATAVGVALPLLIGWLSSLLHNFKRKKEIIKEFQSELEYNRQALVDWKDTKILPASSIKHLKTTIYELALSTGDLKLLNNQARKDIAETYELSIIFNDCMQEQTKFFFDKGKLNEDIKEIMVSLKTQILESIIEINSLL